MLLCCGTHSSFTLSDSLALAAQLYDVLYSMEKTPPASDQSPPERSDVDEMKQPQIQLVPPSAAYGSLEGSTFGYPRPPLVAQDPSSSSPASLVSPSSPASADGVAAAVSAASAEAGIPDGGSIGGNGGDESSGDGNANASIAPQKEADQVVLDPVGMTHARSRSPVSILRPLFLLFSLFYFLLNVCICACIDVYTPVIVTERERLIAQIHKDDNVVSLYAVTFSSSFCYSLVGCFCL